MTVKCIDISHWQDFPDFEKVADDGVIAMIHKCTEGTGYIDPNRAKNCTNATNAGIKCATYHWIKPGDGVSQMRFYLDVLEPVAGERVVIDYEESGCQLDDLCDAVEYLKSDSRDLKVTIYSGHLLKEQLGNTRNEYLAKNTDLWLAQYTSGTPTWSDETYPEYALWQYSESGHVDGIYGSEVDLNEFNGTDEELLEWISPADERPSPRFDTVYVPIITPPNVKVKAAVITTDELQDIMRRHKR